MNFFIIFLISIASISLWVGLPFDFNIHRGVEYEPTKLLDGNFQHEKFFPCKANISFPYSNAGYGEIVPDDKNFSTPNYTEHQSPLLEKVVIVHNAVQIYVPPKPTLEILFSYLSSFQFLHPHTILLRCLQSQISNVKGFMECFKSYIVSVLQTKFESELEYCLSALKSALPYIAILVHFLPFPCLFVALQYKIKEIHHMQKGIEAYQEALRTYVKAEKVWKRLVKARCKKRRKGILTNTIILNKIFEIAHSFGAPLFNIRETVDKEFQKNLLNFIQQFIVEAKSSRSRRINTKALNRNMAQRKQAWIMDIGTTNLDEILDNEYYFELYTEAHRDLEEKIKDKNLLRWHTSDYEDDGQRDREEKEFLKVIAPELWKMKWPKDF